MHVAVIIPAAGSSRRYVDSAKAQGNLAPRQKLDEDLGGRPVLQRTVELFTKHPDVVAIIVAGPADDEAYQAFTIRHGDKLAVMGVKLCRGGAEHRYETVANALKLVPEHATHVAVHDAARPCASAELIERVLIAASAGNHAVIPGLDVPDTLKRISGEEVDAEPNDPLAGILGADPAGRPKARVVKETVERAGLVGVQTPQVFEVELLRRAYAQKNLSSTDDAQLVERLGERVVIVRGEATNIKLTRAEDLPLARAILGFKTAEEKSAHLRF